MARITPLLSFNTQAEEAREFYLTPVSRLGVARETGVATGRGSSATDPG